MLSEVLGAAPTGALGNVQDNTGSGTSPLISEIAALGRRQPFDEGLGDERQRARVLPCLQFLEVTHTADYGEASGSPAPNLCVADLFLATCAGRLKPLRTLASAQLLLKRGARWLATIPDVREG